MFPQASRLIEGTTPILTRLALRAFFVAVAFVWFTAAAHAIIDLKSFVSTPARQYLIPSSVYALKMDVFVSKSLSFTDWAFFVSDVVGISLLFAGACAALTLAMTSRLGRLLE